MMQISPPWAKSPNVVALFSLFGDDLRAVGGCVRDAVMGRDVNDVDFATTLIPEDVRKLCTRAGLSVHDTGVDFGTVTVVVAGEPFEITTLRRDVETDGRRAVVAFTQDWAEDAQRRDFRCNAIYMDANGVLFDEADGGIRDAMDRKLVFVGDAEQRIREDYLRVLRLFRFQATLNATADEVGLAACQKLASGIPTLSGERIEKEMMKLMGADDPVPSVAALVKTGVYFYVFPGRSPDLMLLDKVCELTSDPAVRLASLFAYDGEAAKAAMDHWKSSNELRDQVVGANVRLSMFGSHREAVYRIGFPMFRDRYILDQAHMLGSTVKGVQAVLDDLEANIPVFPVKGQDVLDAGVKPGRQVGVILKDVETWWIASGYPDRDACVDRIKRSVPEAA